jgi:DNA-binding NtrC family response regulator/predicted hydrocarbon binding protein
MRAEDLRLDELVTFADGSLGFHGRRLLLHSLNAMAQFRRDLVEMAGKDQARRILTRFGYFHGNADAAAMKRLFDWDSLEELLKAGPRLQTVEGVAKGVVKSLTLDGGLRMEVVWHGSGEAEEHLLELGPATEPACWILCGYASGFASYCLGRNVFFVEDKCRACGDRICHAVGMEAEGHGDALRRHLPYFQQDDIRGKIRRLTQELRERNHELQRHQQRLQQLEKIQNPSFAEVRSRAFQQVLDMAARIAPFDSSVLITGESGVGKEVLARFIHESSQAAAGPFVAINCGALPETLLDSELFGHKAGAFTGATRDRVGLFEEARKGTILLDEIGEVTPALQVKLLRVLQEKEVLRLGENTPRKVDVRVLAATNRDLRQMVQAGSFREDLFYRLSVIEIRVPPLRERREDILPLARFFVKSLAKKLRIPKLQLDATCLEYLTRYSWPGNVRELMNSLERAAVLSQGGLILPDGLPPAVLEAGGGHHRLPGDPNRSLADMERDHIRAVLAMTNGNRSHAARVLDVSPSTLWRKLKEMDGGN